MKKKTKNEIDEVGVGTGQSGIRKGYPGKDELFTHKNEKRKSKSIED